MIEYKELVLSDFHTILQNGYEYMSTIIGQYEVTLEPHIIAGFSVGIYRAKDRLALKKLAVWSRNHPSYIEPPHIRVQLFERALDKANFLLNNALNGEYEDM